ncbi:hypothetical protein ACFFF5_08545 [Lederbergia wuyishanensis]|uniref:Uncharacterized protein n=1 Tax=Lederbergia wuyishanensis TaxID=1347903 RepID=A0ABU0D6E2_9BACI|nr:hypothetical protein [Lederbergia wuyishanensis]MCJ8008651.1 hypothetical protein [Lederbergia wuyishanensis]MDQ0343931.1 hypothetical protein [Lederbergia wuyishanensis]
MMIFILITTILGFVAVVNRLDNIYKQNKIMIEILENTLDELSSQENE